MFDNPTGRQILTFYINDEIYGMPVEFIKEISNLSPIRLEAESRVQLRAIDLPLVNLRSKLQLESPFFPAANNLVIIGVQNRSCAVLVDGIDCIVRIPAGVHRDGTLLQANAPYVTEIAVHQKKSIRVLDILACLGLDPQNPAQKKAS